MPPLTTLIDTSELAAHLGDPDWVLLDCRFDLANPLWGRESWAAGHLPGAQFADLERDLSGPVGARTGRHPLPEPADFAARASRWGIDQRTQVIVYDQGNGMYAARAWWLLRWLGHRNVAMLDGGMAAWIAAGQSTEIANAARAPRTFIARPDAGAIVDASFVGTVSASQMAPAGASAVRLVDARGADRFAGQNETLDPVAGHVPGARNHPFTLNQDPAGRMLPAAELRARWAQTLQSVPPSAMVAMCGSGVSACVNLLALEHAGLPGARLYPGSWSEWSRDPSRPVATGAP